MANKDMKEIGMVELALDQLDSVVGGVITPAQKATLNGVLKMAKKSGKSLDDVIASILGYYNSLHAMYPDVTLEEVQDYVLETWDSI